MIDITTRLVKASGYSQWLTLFGNYQRYLFYMVAESREMVTGFAHFIFHDTT